jgi:hypothetical protein
MNLNTDGQLPFLSRRLFGRSSLPFMGLQTLGALFELLPERDAIIRLDCGRLDMSDWVVGEGLERMVDAERSEGSTSGVGERAERSREWMQTWPEHVGRTNERDGWEHVN